MCVKKALVHAEPLSNRTRTRQISDPAPAQPDAVENPIGRRLLPRRRGFARRTDPPPPIRPPRAEKPSVSGHETAFWHALEAIRPSRFRRPGLLPRAISLFSRQAPDSVPERGFVARNALQCRTPLGLDRAEGQPNARTNGRSPRRPHADGGSTRIPRPSPNRVRHDPTDAPRCRGPWHSRASQRTMKGPKRREAPSRTPPQLRAQVPKHTPAPPPKRDPPPSGTLALRSETRLSNTPTRAPPDERWHGARSPRCAR